MMTIQVPTIGDMVVALVLAGWLGVGGVKVLGALAHAIRSVGHRVSNRGRVWELEMERDELLAANALLKSRGSRNRKRRNRR